MNDDFRCGYVAVVGRPNVGKSTFINAVMGRKISIVTNKPQTTRHRILAVHNRPGAQIVFVDTPGIHRNAKRAMNRLMNQTAASALSDADLALFVIEAHKFTEEDADVLHRIRRAGLPAFLLLNKVDLVHPKERLLEIIAERSAQFDFAEVFPISARRQGDVDAVLGAIPGYLDVSPPFFPDDMPTDRSPEFLAAELIREKLTNALQKELPYGITVQIDTYRREERGLRLDATVWVERDSQKRIVIGSGGRVLKQVGSLARRELKEQLGCPVHLELWVKVKDNWADSEQDLLRLGFEAP